MLRVPSKAGSGSVSPAAFLAALRNAASFRVCQYPQAKAVSRRTPRGIPTPAPKTRALQDLSSKEDVPAVEVVGAFVNPEDEGSDEEATAMVPVMLTCCTAPGCKENVSDGSEQLLWPLHAHWPFEQYCINSLLL